MAVCMMIALLQGTTVAVAAYVSDPEDGVINEKCRFFDAA